MGLAFLPNSNIGLDPTITCWDRGVTSAQKMSDVYPSFDYNIPNPDIRLFSPDSPTTSKHNPNDEGDNGIVSISINDKTEDCTLPHILQRNPVDSGRLWRTLADSISVTWAKFVCLIRTVR